MLFNIQKAPLIMGIINVTPDSFSGDGIMTENDYVAVAVDLAARLIAEGADMLDIGGESSRPGAISISADEEIRRIAPVIAAIKKSAPAIPVSIDTVKAKVAKAALEAGATIINDISGHTNDGGMMKLAAAHGAYIILMHNRSDADNVMHDPRLGGHYMAPVYADIIEDVAIDLAQSIKAARMAGIAAEKIIVDPGLGFGKTIKQNCILINQLDRLKAKLGCPVLIGPSRKSFIGRALDLPVDTRLEGTAAAVAIGIARGADIVRVHDVEFMARVAKMARIIAHSGPVISGQ